MRRTVIVALLCCWLPGWAAQVPEALFSGLSWRCTGPDGGPVAAVSGLAGQPGQYTLRTPAGDLFSTTDGGESWNAGGSLPAAAGTEWTDPQNPRRMIRAAADGVAVSLDAGATWTPWRNLAIAQVASLPGGAAEAGEGRLRFRATATGVEVSFDAGGAWQPLQLNLPRVAVRALAIRGDDLIAATWGRSVWELDDIGPLRQIAAGPEAASGSRLFAPASAELPHAALFDYYLDSSVAGDGPVTLEVVNARGEVVHAASSAPASPDFWYAAPPRLDAAAGEHRVAWDLRYDPPPAPTQRYHRLAPALFTEIAAAPPGALAPPGAYTVRLRAAGRVYTQPLAIRGAASEARLGFERNIMETMEAIHREHLEVAAERAQLQPLLQDANADIAQAASDLDTALAAVNGAHWTGVVLPDEAENESAEPVEDKDADGEGYTPIAESISQDYDDPTVIIGRTYDNAAVAPSFSSVSAAMAQRLAASEKAEGAPAPPGPFETSAQRENCAQLRTVFADWRQALAGAAPLDRLLAAAGRARLDAPPAMPAGPVCQ